MKLRTVPLMKSRLGRTVIIGIPLTLLLFQPASVTTQSSSINTRPELVFQSGHNSRVNCAVFSPDGRWLISGGGDNTIRLWDTTSGAELRAFLGHTQLGQDAGCEWRRKEVGFWKQRSQCSDLLC